MWAVRDGAPACPHGDPCCPCQDGDPCHYEGRRVTICPLTNTTAHHCHIEGCAWPERIDAAERLDTTCGLAKLGYTYTLSPFADSRGKPHWACGAARNLMSDPSPLRVLIYGPVSR